jgi:hypothetical protein
MGTKFVKENLIVPVSALSYSHLEQEYLNDRQSEAFLGLVGESSYIVRKVVLNDGTVFSIPSSDSLIANRSI